METLKLNFDTHICDTPHTLTVKVPYQEGMVATSSFCPKEFLTGSVDLMAAVRGETLDRFLSSCNLLLHAASKISDAENTLDRLIGGLMALVMTHFSQNGKMTTGDLLLYVDCFSHLLEAEGFEDPVIRLMYPRIVKTIVDLYPDNVVASI